MWSGGKGGDNFKALPIVIASENRRLRDDFLRFTFKKNLYCGDNPIPCTVRENLWQRGAEIIVDNCQCTLFGAFAPNSKTAEEMSRNLGKQTVLSGTVTRSSGNGGSNRQLQMIERSLMTVDELKSMPKGHFIVMKTGCHPMKTRLKLFFKWGIQFEEAYSIEEKSERKVQYADCREVEAAVLEKFPPKMIPTVPAEFAEDYSGINEESTSRKHSPKTRKRIM